MQRIYRLSCFLLVSVLSACSEDSPPAATSSFSSSPEALVSENTKSGGIYKGVIVGSSGFFTVVLQNGIKEVRLTMDGESKSLATTALPDWTSGEPVKNALFVSGDWQATFSVGVTGGAPAIVISIPGHPDTQTVITKELSTDIVRVFEGTFAGTSNGTWNFVIQGAVLSGISRTSDGSGNLAFVGLVNGTTIVLNTLIGNGTISGDSVSGTWEDPSSGGSGTWTGKRIL